MCIKIYTLLCLVHTTVHGASYLRYGESSSQYPNQYSTISNYFDREQYPYKNGAISTNIDSIPIEATRYPNYNANGYSTTPGYSSYGSSYQNQGNGYGQSGLYRTNTARYGDSYNSYNTPRYGEGYNTRYGSGYNTGYNSGYTSNSYEMPFMRNAGDYCINRSPQTQFYEDRFMGMWYGVEMIQHLAGDSRVDLSPTCIVIHISEPVDQPSSVQPPYHVEHMKAKFRQSYRHLRLLWDEAGQNIEYALYFRNDSIGYWQVLDGQNGTMASRSHYQQFSGTIQVLKAVSNHLVLNFCQEAMNGRPAQLYSVLFSRDPSYLDRRDIESVHSLLQNKHLSVASRRMVCGNGADRPLLSIMCSLITCVLAYVVGASS